MRLLLLMLMCGACVHRTPAPASAGAVSSSRKVVVGMVVDQLAAWVLAERIDSLPPTGGFARLRREGVYARDMRYAHAVTETGPGHAALYTACAPWKSGIFANQRMQSDGQEVPLLLGPDTQELLPHGSITRASFSLARLTCETVADRLRAAEPQAWIVSLSFKDRASLIPAGKHADAALWFDTALDTFVTTSAVASTFPHWAVSLADHDAVARGRPSQWDLLDPAFVRAHAVGPDEAPGEMNFEGLGTTFPHPIRNPGVGNAFRATPFADAFLLQLGTEALGVEAAAGSAPALLELSLSSNDIIGHAFGPESWEAWDELLRLDRSLGQFMERLDTMVGPDNWSLVLSADHGVTVLPESVAGARWCDAGASNPWELPCKPGVRIAVPPLLLRLRLAAELALGKGDWVAGVSPPYVRLGEAGQRLTGPRRDKLDQALRKALEQQPGVAQVFDTRTLPSPCPPETEASIAALVCRSVVPGQGGEYYLVSEPGALFDYHQSGHGTDHGSPYVFDRSVPLLARVPGKLPRGRTITDPVPYETFARTLASALGVDFPAAAAGVDLTVAAPGLVP